MKRWKLRTMDKKEEMSWRSEKGIYQKKKNKKAKIKTEVKKEKKKSIVTSTSPAT